MGSLYIQEPLTDGKVVLKTTVGDIDIELWSKETPKACRNFVQLCLEQYYDGTPFHRVIKGFIAQGGDPNGDGSGGESIYGEPFKDEFHSRLRFVRRGLVAMANGGKDDNASQFFFTLGPCQELQNKNTIFGKVSGNTLFNMLKLEDCSVDGEERPLYPHKIISTEVLKNPFEDIIPRIKEESIKIEVTKTEPKKQKNFKLLSFGEEAEEDETEVESLVAFKGKSKSMHDLIIDPKLSSVSAAALYTKDEDTSLEKLERVKKKLKTEKSESKSDNSKLKDETSHHSEENLNDEERRAHERKKVQDEIKMLTRELKKRKKAHEAEIEIEETETEKEETTSENPLLMEFHEQRKLFKSKIKEIASSKDERQKQTMELLAKFQQKIRNAQENVSSTSEKSSSKRKKDNEEDDDDTWMTHTLKCDDQVVIAKDANMKSNDWYDITDPRNPINERKRQGKRK